MHLPTPITACLVANLVWPTAAAGESRLFAQVIGIDEYVLEGASLEGAVNDARDLADALRGLEPAELEVLLDGEATRERILGTWERYLHRASSGDTILISYAGHGAQELAPDAPEEPDGLDEVLILSGFGPAGDATRQRIFDNEIAAFAERAGQRGVEVVLVADACFAGGLTRSADPGFSGVSRSRARFTRYQLSDDRLSDEEKRPTGLADAASTSLLSLLAQTEEESIYELELPVGTGIKRGALSFALGRGLRGEADLDGDGVLTRRELFRFLRDQVPVLSGQLQEPELLPKSDLDQVVFRLPNIAQDVRKPRADVTNYAVRVTGDSAPTLPAGSVPAGGEAFDFEWNPDDGAVFDFRGDRVAERIRDAAALVPVFEKWRVVATIRDHYASGVSLRAVPARALYCRGQRLRVRIDEFQTGYLYLFNLAGDGTVQLLWPLDEQEAVPQSQPWSLSAPDELEAGPPYGVDHLLALVSPHELTDLATALTLADGKPIDEKMAERLRRLAPDEGLRWGMLPIYTSANNSDCGGGLGNDD